MATAHAQPEACPLRERAGLFDTYDYLTVHGIGAYGGGMFEQGPGRGQLQYLASLFHPDTPNDLAPTAYNLISHAQPAALAARGAAPRDRLSLGDIRRPPDHPRADRRSVDLVQWGAPASPVHLHLDHWGGTASCGFSGRWLHPGRGVERPQPWVPVASRVPAAPTRPHAVEHTRN